MHRRRVSTSRRKASKRAGYTVKNHQTTSLANIKSIPNQRQIHASTSTTQRGAVVATRHRSVSHTNQRKHFTTQVRTPVEDKHSIQSPSSDRPKHPYVFFKASDVLPKSERNEKIFPFGLTIGVDRKHPHDLNKVVLDKSAARYLKNLELGSRHMFSNFAPMGVRQVKGIRLALFGTQSQIEKAPWECYRGLITESPRVKGSVLIRVPLSIAFTDADRPVPPSETNPSAAVLKPLIDITHLLVNDSPDETLDLVKPHLHLTKILYQSMLSPSSVNRVSLPFGPTTYIANNMKKLVDEIGKSYDGHLYCSLGPAFPSRDDEEKEGNGDGNPDAAADAAVSGDNVRPHSTDPRERLKSANHEVNLPIEKALQQQKEENERILRETFESDELLKHHVVEYDLEKKRLEEEEANSVPYPLALDPLLLGLYHPQIPMNTLRDMMYEQIRRTSFRDPGPVSPATEQILLSTLPVPISLVDQVIIYSTRQTQSLMQLAVQSYHLNQFNPYNSKFLSTHGLAMTLSHISTRSIEVPNPISKKYRDWKVFEENQINAANILQSAALQFEQCLDRYQREYAATVEQQKARIKAKHAAGEEVTNDDLNIMVPTPSLMQMKIENPHDKLTDLQKELRMKTPEIMLLPYIDFINHSLSKHQNNVDLHFEFEETSIMEELLTEDDDKMVKKVILGLEMEIRQLEMFLKQYEEQSPEEQQKSLMQNPSMNPRIAQHKVNHLRSVLERIEHSLNILKIQNTLPVVSVIAKRDILAGEELCLAYHRLNDGGKSIYNPYSTDTDEKNPHENDGEDVIIKRDGIDYVEDHKKQVPHADVDDISPFDDPSLVRGERDGQDDYSSASTFNRNTSMSSDDVWKQENAYDLLLNYGIVSPNNPSLVVPVDVETAYHRFILRSDQFKQKLSLEERIAQKVALKKAASSSSSTSSSTPTSPAPQRSLPPPLHANLHKRYHKPQLSTSASLSQTANSNDNNQTEQDIDQYNTLLSVLYHHTTKELPLIHITSKDNSRPQFVSVERGLKKILDDCLQSEYLRENTLIYHILAIEPEIIVPILASRFLFEISLSLWSPKFSTSPFTLESLAAFIKENNADHNQSSPSPSSAAAAALSILGGNAHTDNVDLTDVSPHQMASWVKSTLPTPQKLSQHLLKQTKLDEDKKIVKSLSHPRFIKYAHYTNVAGLIAEHRSEQMRLVISQYTEYYDILESKYGTRSTKM